MLCDLGKYYVHRLCTLAQRDAYELLCDEKSDDLFFTVELLVVRGSEPCGALYMVDWCWCSRRDWTLGFVENILLYPSLEGALTEGR